MIAYIDSSCAVSLVKEEPITGQLRAYIDDWLDHGHLVIAGALLETEVHRVAQRFDIATTDVKKALTFVTFVQHTDGDFTLAGRLPGRSLVSLNALHLATAIRAGADAMFTEDQRLTTAAELAGIPVLDTAIPRTLHG